MGKKTPDYYEEPHIEQSTSCCGKVLTILGSLDCIDPCHVVCRVIVTLNDGNADPLIVYTRSPRFGIGTRLLLGGASAHMDAMMSPGLEQRKTPTLGQAFFHSESSRRTIIADLHGNSGMLLVIHRVSKTF